VVLAKVARITKKETKTFAEIDASVLWSKFEHDSSKDLRLTVLTEDEQRKDCGYPIGQEGERHLLYLRRDRENEYSTNICSGNLGDGQQGHGIRVAFEKKQPVPSTMKAGVKTQKQDKCVCEKLDARGLYDRADVVVHANIKHIIEKGTAKFVDLENVLDLKKDELLPDFLRVYTGDIDSECRYIASEEGHHILYLWRDKNGGFSTDHCSGNLGPRDGVNLAACGYWLQKQRHPFLNAPVQDGACLKR
jgi:hypothetical protein